MVNILKAMKTPFQTRIKSIKDRKKSGLIIFLSLLIILPLRYFWIISLETTGILFGISILVEIAMHFKRFKRLKIQENNDPEKQLFLKTKNNEVNIEGPLKMSYWCSYRFHNYTYDSIWNPYTWFINPQKDTEPTHGTTFTLNVIIEDEKGERLHFTQSLPAWSDYPEGWEYQDAVFSQKEELFLAKNLRKMVKILKAKDNVTICDFSTEML